MLLLTTRLKILLWKLYLPLQTEVHVYQILCYVYKCINFVNTAGADIILDFVGAPYWEKHSQCVATDGRIVHLGFVSRLLLYFS